MTGFIIDKGPLRPAAVYRLADASGFLLYAGKAYDPDRRCSAHQYTKSWWPQVANREDVWFESMDIADGAEAIAIVTEKPCYNIARQHDAGIGDQSLMQQRLGIIPDRGTVMLTSRHAEPVPLRVGAVIGVEPGALAVHDWRVYGREGIPAWGVASWDCPRPGGPILRYGDGGDEIELVEGRRQASAQEAQSLGLGAEAILDVTRYTMSDQFGATRALVEVVRAPSVEWDLAGASASGWLA